jgi:ATP-dependent Lon protease
MKENNNKGNTFREEMPSILPVIPTIDVVVFPQMVVPLLILDEKIIKGVEKAFESTKKILLLAAQQPVENYQTPISIDDLYKIGTVGNIMRIMHLPEGGIKILTQGIVRARVEKILSNDKDLTAKISPLFSNEKSYDEEEAETQIKNIILTTEKIASNSKMFGPDFQVILSQIEDPERVADFILSHLTLSVDQAQNLLEKQTLNNLLEGIHVFLQHESELNTMEEKIRNETRDSINKSQREYYLREQMKAIQKELGDYEEIDSDDFSKKIHETTLPEEARTEAIKQMNRLKRTAPDSMEATVIRSHLEWLLGLPWGTFTEDNLDIKHAKEVLDTNHYGLDDIKDRILDFLSIKKLKNDCKVPILCLSGPPGVGKTSLGQAIAKSLGRKFFRLSLGGVYDESEIRGHRRTYVGSLPGRFIQAIRKAGSMNPLIMIDEVDKIGMSNRGDPSAALLEVLDPEQNSAFYDNYIGIHFDMSKCLFITTANDLSTISAPLRDRMEIIELSGYTEDEKSEIAKQHLVDKAITNSGLTEKNVKIGRDVILEIIQGYTQESGVRTLERHIQKLCSKYARNIVEKEENVIFTTDNLCNFLGPRKLLKDHILKHNKIGVSNGLAWTPFGGEILQIETILMPGTGKLLLTGHLGDVMKESAQAALSYARSHAKIFHIDRKKFSECDIHIHLPAGAIPKDGPSAGITLLSSLLSAYTGRKINGTFAMTGELNLQGEVLPIGKLKEKILAAKQHGLEYVIAPKLNENDLIGLEKTLQGISILLVENVEEVLKHVLLPMKI